MLRWTGHEVGAEVGGREEMEMVVEERDVMQEGLVLILGRLGNIEGTLKVELGRKTAQD
jgi:hypothetical protein